MKRSSIFSTHLEEHLVHLIPLKSYEEKSHYLTSFIDHPYLEMVKDLPAEEGYLMKLLYLMGQNHLLSLVKEEKVAWGKLIERLKVLDKFYQDFGGVLGYQCEVLKLLEKPPLKEDTEYFVPPFIDIKWQTKEVDHYIACGIEHLPEYAELYAIGGAADRLNLIDGATKEDLPAAKLILIKWTLLEYLIRDLFAREFLYFELFSKQLFTPIAMMTSEDKNNDLHIRNICEGAHFFGRDPQKILFFRQPLVPTFNRLGEWVISQDDLLLKPGGHGMIWKLALQEKIIETLLSQGRSKALVRQINNPIAGVDYGQLAFLGIGFEKDYSFGFASCPRRENAKEGINVLKKIVRQEKPYFALSNIEYCDFNQEIKESDKCPANTNILFIDLKEMEKAIEKQPYPGVLLNFKQSGQIDEIARLELTMQNIADSFEDEKEKHQKTFIALGQREKTIAAIKKTYQKEGAFLETPEGTLLAMLKNAHELFTLCGMQLPYNGAENLEDIPFFITYHPALGPLYTIIQQKIKGGKLHAGSDLWLEIADLYMKEVEIAGSFKIETAAVMGHLEKNRLVFSGRRAKCILEDVIIQNRGIDTHFSPNFVTGKVHHKEQCFILLGENAEFIAKNVTLKGDFMIHVPNDTRCTAMMKGRKVEFIYEQIKCEEPLYAYSMEDNQVKLKLCREV